MVPTPHLPPHLVFIFPLTHNRFFTILAFTKSKFLSIEKELITMRDRLANGLPLSQMTWDAITRTAARSGVKDTDRFARAVIG